MVHRDDPVRTAAVGGFVRLEAGETVAAVRERLEESDIGVLTIGDEIAALVSQRKLAGVDDDVRLASVIDRLPPTVVVPGGLTVGEALAYPALRAVDEEAPGVLVRDGDAIGLWSGASLVRAALTLGPTRSVDTLLQGTIDVPHIVRLCAFDDNGVACGDRRTFAELPDRDSMPECRNPKHLTTHEFKW